MDSGYTTPIRTNTPPSASGHSRATPTNSLTGSSSAATTASAKSLFLQQPGGVTSHGTLPHKGLMVKRFHSGTPANPGGSASATSFYHAYQPTAHQQLSQQQSVPAQQQQHPSLRQQLHHGPLQGQQSVPVLGRAITGSPGASSTLSRLSSNSSNNSNSNNSSATLKCSSGSTDSLQKVKRVYL